MMGVLRRHNSAEGRFSSLRIDGRLRSVVAVLRGVDGGEGHCCAHGDDLTEDRDQSRVVGPDQIAGHQTTSEMRVSHLLGQLEVVSFVAVEEVGVFVEREVLGIVSTKVDLVSMSGQHITYYKANHIA